MKTDRTKKISAVSKRRCRTINLRNYVDENFLLTMNLAQYLRSYTFSPQKNQYLRSYTLPSVLEVITSCLRSYSLLVCLGEVTLLWISVLRKLCCSDHPKMPLLEDLTRLHGIFGVSEQLNQKVKSNAIKEQSALFEPNLKRFNHQRKNTRENQLFAIFFFFGQPVLSFINSISVLSWFANFFYFPSQWLFLFLLMYKISS